jgi:tryptophan synthase beta chain
VTAQAPARGRGARPQPTGANRLGVLGEIADRRRSDLLRELGDRTLRELERAAHAAPPPRDPTNALLRPGLHVIAEAKRRSPSSGDLAAPGADVVARARAYAAGGAAIVSVLVEPHWFGGSMADLTAVRAAVPVPVLAKDFVVDPRQLPLLRAAGADLALLIAAMHRAPALRHLVRVAREVGLEPLVEVHEARELDRALASGARLIGINNRDLRSLAVDPDHAAALRSHVPDDRLVVAESGAVDPGVLSAWRALGFDAALVGEALMRAGTGPDDVRARTAAFVAAGRSPSGAEDIAAADREPWVKICGVTDRRGVDAVVAAGADAIGLNLVEGTPRCLSVPEAAALASHVRAVRGSDGRPRVVGVVGDIDPARAANLAGHIGLDAIQWSGRLPLPAGDLGLPAIAVVRGPVAGHGGDGPVAGHAADGNVAPPDSPGDGAAATAGRIAADGRVVLRRPGVERLILDAAHADALGGTGSRAGVPLAAAVAREIPVVLAGGLTAANVTRALRTIPAVGVDVASGVEAAHGRRVSPDDRTEPAGPTSGTARPRPRPRKDPFLVGLFVKRARAARLDLPLAPSRPTPIAPGLLDADARGRWGTERQFGGRYVPETLVSALRELEEAWFELRDDPRYWADLRVLRRDYVGRPSPLYRADRLAAEVERRAGREPGRLRLYLKREDLNHTGAHKITNALGQALLTRRLGKRRVIAETGAGQHGVATATACALLGLPCTVFMGREDIRRQAPNVLRMRALGAEVREVTSGSATLKDATNEAMRDWVTNVRTTHYVLGSAVGPHPYPTVVRDLQRVIGDEAAAQLAGVQGRLPDAVVACVGGGSNAIGLFTRFIGEPSVRLVAVEAAGEGIETGRHAAALAGGTPGVLHGARSYMLQDSDGQVVEAVSLSAGLDYPGIGPQISALYDAGRMEVLAATDAEAVDALMLLTRTEGIIPALEPAHAIAALPSLLRGGAQGDPAAGGRPGSGRSGTGLESVRPMREPLPADALVVLGLSGRGDKDMGVLGGEADA